MLTGRYFLVFWPDEDSYSEVPESKIVGNPGSLGEAIQVKERQKVYTGLLVAVGSKQQVQEKLNTIEEQSLKVPELEPVTSTNNPESVTATTPAAPIATVTTAAPTTVATTHAPSTTPPSPMTVATINAPSTTPAGPMTMATTNVTGTTPAAPAESNPKTGKKQGIRILVVSVDHCVRNVFVEFNVTIHAIVKLHVQLLTSWLSSSPCVYDLQVESEKYPQKR